MNGLWMKKGMRICTVMVLLFSILNTHAIRAKSKTEEVNMELYVSLQGSDKDDGSMNRPFRTIMKAQKVIQDMNAIPKGGITVYIREGVYSIDDTLSFTRKDSGEQDAPITYQNYKDEHVCISGGVRLKKSDFTRVNDEGILNRLWDEKVKDKLLQVDLDAAGIEDYGHLSRRGYVHNDAQQVTQMELFVEEQRMTLSRWPNYEKMLWTSIVDQGHILSQGQDVLGGPTLAFDKTFERSKKWMNREDIWMDGILSYDWVWGYNRIQHMDSEKRQVTLTYGTQDGVFDWGETRGVFFQNILEEIDMPGEYYIDRDAKKLYYYPTTAFQESPDPEILLSHANKPLLSLKNCAYMNFKGIVFDGTRSDGIVCHEGDNHHITFEGITVKHIGQTGIVLHGTDIKVLDSDIYNLGSAGVRVNGGDKKTLTSSHNTITNCHIYNVGQIRKGYNPALSMDGVGVVVSHNLIHDTPHMAITVRGNDHFIAYNECYNISQIFRDMGIIYMNLGARPYERGTHIYRNYFHDYWSINDEHDDNNGVYLDNGTQGVLINENIFYRSDVVGIFTHGGGFNTMKNNLFIDVSGPYRDVNFMQTGWGYWIIRNTVKQWAEQKATMDFASMPHAKYDRLVAFYNFDDTYVSEMMSLDSAEDDRPWNKFGGTMQNAQPDNVFKDNVIYNHNNPMLSRHEEGIWRNTGHGTFSAVVSDGNVVMDENPGFVDYDNDDFTLKPDAKVHTLMDNFPNIPFHEMGLYVNENRPSLPASTVGKVKLIVSGHKKKETVILKEGDTFLVSSEVLPKPSVGEKPLIIYRSSNETIAVVDAGGKVTGLSPGFVEITAHSANNMGIYDGHMFRVDKDIQKENEDLNDADSRETTMTSTHEKMDVMSQDRESSVDASNEKKTGFTGTMVSLGILLTIITGGVIFLKRRK
ncbi:right-handed parallel beta-helix repeat-containing protein [Vallitalea pronyensis]|uniref:Right-handed parallel beta-helix repeat-containing protein n=1 Tax=Vallitalea pronyensis TaxID=1348613 RepID=A0A8J8MIK6_9FIRM|nr:right-handed parallel beta-helix repeat-containing protein [Vallitalea pronyensis]QUI22299.1 right-handed parallel beta-helix repeat-containing protein [Vallitalea pronyensis]